MDKPLALSTAYATWVRGENNNNWIVRDQSGEQIGEFPRHWKEKDCMTAIRLGRKFELIAFNLGIAFGKQKREESLLPAMGKMREQIAVLEQMNVRLSEKLEKLIIGENHATD